MNSPDMQDIVAAEMRPGAELASDNELLSYARATGVTISPSFNMSYGT